jgi:chromate transporter
MDKDPAITQSQEPTLSEAKAASASLAYIFWTFLKIGSTAFGGFMALISVVENIVVQRRKLLAHEDMLDGISLATILPGPMAVNVVAYVGYRIRGVWGAVASAVSVLLPSYVLIVAFTIFYLQAGEIAAVDRAFAGFVPAMVAIILTAAWRMSKKTIKSFKNWKGIAIALASGLLLMFVGGFYITLIIVVASGLLGYIWYHEGAPRNISDSSPQSESSARTSNSNFSKLDLIVSFAVLACFLLLYLLPLPFADDSLAKLFTTFSGMSLLLFGSGYVFIPLIQDLVVNQYNWVTASEFTNAIALGQVTPGPILISAAFIGYAVKGILGSIVATVAIFFPPAMLMITCSHILDQIKQSSVIQAALKGIRPAVIGLIFTAAIVFAQTAEMHWATLIIFVGAMVAMLRFRVDVIMVIPVAGLLGLFLYP